MSQTHYMSMIIISVGSFFFGILPLSFSVRVTKCCPLFLSLILCLGGGVLLATSIIHMLTEVQIKLKESAQLYFCAGFLILYAFDELIHYFLNIKNPHTIVSMDDETCPNVIKNKTNIYGALETTNLEVSPLLAASCSSAQLDFSTSNSENENTCHTTLKELCDKTESENDATGNFSHLKSMSEDQIQCHVEIIEPCSSNPVTKTGLLVALTIHSILEGISIGVQTEIKEIFLLLGTISLHKIVLSFCLGLELNAHGFKTLNVVFAILLFSLGSSIGISIGMSLMSPSNSIFNMDFQIQAIAAGSLLYIAAFEVLPRERFRWQHKMNQRAAGIFQFLFVFIGFNCVTFLHLYVVTPHHHDSNNTVPINYNYTG